MTHLLAAAQLHRQLVSLPGWQPEPTAISRVYRFPQFLTAVQAVAEVATIAEAMDHHPDIDIRWRQVTFTLSTHSVGGVTELDVELAHRIEAVANANGAL